MKNIFKNIKKLINSTFLTIRFPFLFVRNRFSNFHYTNRWCYKHIEDHTKLYSVPVCIYGCNKEYIENIKTQNHDQENKNVKIETIIDKEISYKDADIHVYLYDNNIKVNVHTHNDCNIQTFALDDILKNKIEYNKLSDIFIEKRTTTRKFIYTGLQTRSDITIYLVSDEFENYTKFFTYINVILHKFEKYYIAYYTAINKFLQLFHSWSNYTELDDMPTGWRKTFGIQMCKDIKHSLVYTYINNENISHKNIFKYIHAYLKGIKLLYNYRITQIKEKFGTLRWYDANATSDVYKIIDKYEELSYYTCINCGKPAKYISKGWISPYCENCIGNSQYTEIKN